MKIFTSKTQRIGKIGEDIASSFLLKRGHEIIERNYTLKCGELDIISRETSKIHFIEVKSIACDLVETPEPWKYSRYYRPEENLHPKKMSRIKTTLQTYLMSLSKRQPGEDKGQPREANPSWQFDLYVVYVDDIHKKGIVKPIENIIL